MAELARIAEDNPVNDDTAIEEWAQRRGFGKDAWLMDQASRAVAAWRRTPSHAGRWLSLHGGVGAWIPPEPPAPDWDPVFETEAAFRGRVDQYIEAMKAMPHITKAPEKRTGLSHFDWLALHQVAGWTHADINEEYSDEKGTPDVSAISRAIAETAKLADVTLRDARGRKLH
jgi:hypothetical protein